MYFCRLNNPFVMKRYLLIVLLLTIGLTLMARERDTLGTGTAVAFTENAGQWDSRVCMESQLNDAAVFLERGAITVALREHRLHPAPQFDEPRYHAYRMSFAGGAAIEPEGHHRSSYSSNYFLGDNPARWRGGVSTFGSALYRDIYSGIDLEIYGGSAALKYNIIVHPGADASVIAIDYEGTDAVSVTQSGSMLIRTSVRDIVEMKPYVYQIIDGKEHEVSSRWRVKHIKDVYRATIEIGEYNHACDLVIDPVLIFSTYTGSTADNWGTTAAYDSKKNVYTAGLVFNIGYPVSTGAYQPTFGGEVDIAIFKFDSTGSNRLFATYLGGSGSDMPHSMFVNSFDELIVFGTTGSSNYPVTAGAFQTSFAGGQNINYLSTSAKFPQGSDLFVSRLSENGQQLKASTYIGGSGNDGLNYRHHLNGNYTLVMSGNDSLYYNYGDGARGEIITDNLNNIYIGSTTFSTDFPTTVGCVQATNGGRQDGVVLKLDHNLRNLLWSTYLGGSQDDAVYSIDVDSAYNLLVCGGTASANFPTTDGVYQSAYSGGTADGFVSKLSYNGDRIMASTYLGSTLYDQLYFVRVGHGDEVFLFGQTKATGSSMIYNAGYSVPGSGMLLVRMDPTLATRRWSTVFGTPGRINLSPTAFAADICNRVYAAGWGRDFVGYNGVQWNTAGTTGMETSNDAYSTSTDGQDFYIISLDADGNSMEYATFFGEMHQNGVSSGGGDHVDGGTSRFDRLATLYQSVCASCGGHNDFPTTADAWSDSNLSSNCNNALFRFNVTNDFPVAEFVPPTAGCAPYTVQFHNTGRGDSFHWDFGDGTTSTQRDPQHTFTEGGVYTVTLVAAMPSGCSTADTQRHTLHVIQNGNPSSTSYIACGGARIQIGPQPQLGATYQWLTSGVSDPTVANPWVSAAGTYLLRVSATGCNEVDTFVVETYVIADQWGTTPVSCHDFADGSIWLRLGNGMVFDSLQISSTPAAQFQYDGVRHIVADSLAPGNYHISIEGYGCLFEHDFQLTNPAQPAYTKDLSPALCDDSCSGWIQLHYNLASSPSDTLLQHLCPGTYITTLSSDGCPLADTSVILRDHSLDSLRAWAELYDIYLGQSSMLYASTNADDVTYHWHPEGDIVSPNSAITVVTPSDTLACYIVDAQSAAGCTASDTVCIRCTDIVCGAPEFIIPNAFTPNGDGINDRLCFNADILTEFSIAVFNRWGQCVYQSDDPTQCWDGTFRNTPCLAGVYTYTCHIRCHNEIENDFKGDITIIR